MKKFILTISLIFWTMAGIAQPCLENFPCDTLNGDPVYITFEKPPMFNGKDLLEFSKYISLNLDYPVYALKNDINGTVFIKFIINKLGELSDAKIIQGVHPKLDKQVLKAVKSSPKWTPGEINGEPVSVQFILPVKFGNED